jgi:crotonobetainyl-CoA:carnitine CoA-transferase CaiB-like acyl-CoA transferase
VPCAPVLTRNATLDDPQVRANGILEEFDHPRAGRVRDARPAARFSGTPAAIGAPAPAYGADTEAMLREAGVDDREIAAWRRSGAFGADRESEE